MRIGEGGSLRRTDVGAGPTIPSEFVLFGRALQAPFRPIVQECQHS